MYDRQNDGFDYDNTFHNKYYLFNLCNVYFYKRKFEVKDYGRTWKSKDLTRAVNVVK